MTFSYTRPSVCLLEKVAACVKRNEPVLLVGETGTGKTSSVQFLAHTLGQSHFDFLGEEGVVLLQATCYSTMFSFFSVRVCVRERGSMYAGVCLQEYKQCVHKSGWLTCKTKLEGKLCNLLLGANLVL